MSTAVKKKKFAVFDIDGTFFRSHLYWEVVLTLARQDSLHPDLNKRTLELYENWKRRTHKEAFEEFDNKTIELINEMFTQFDPKVYDKALRETIPPLLDQVYVYTKALHTRLKKEGYFTIALSGSRIEEVSLFAPYHKFDDWIGQEYFRDEKGERYTGEHKTTFHSKHILLEEFVKKHNLTFEDSYGIGDTGSDIPMLEMVENPIAFNPNRALLAHAQEKGWKIVLERKSIAYTLEASHDGYVLAETD